MPRRQAPGNTTCHHFENSCHHSLHNLFLQPPSSLLLLSISPYLHTYRLAWIRHAAPHAPSCTHTSPWEGKKEEEKTRKEKRGERKAKAPPHPAACLAGSIYAVYEQDAKHGYVSFYILWETSLSLSFFPSLPKNSASKWQGRHGRDPAILSSPQTHTYHLHYYSIAISASVLLRVCASQQPVVQPSSNKHCGMISLQPSHSVYVWHTSTCVCSHTGSMAAWLAWAGWLACAGLG